MRRWRRHYRQELTCYTIKNANLKIAELASRTGIRRGTLEIVIEEVLWSIRGSYQTIWSFPLTNVKWHSVTWPYTMTTPYWSDFVPNSTFYRILRGFHRRFATGVACRKGTLTPLDNWFRPFWTCIVLLVKTNPFTALVVIFTDYALRISLGTFSTLLTFDVLYFLLNSNMSTIGFPTN